MEQGALLASLLELAAEHELSVRRIPAEAPFEGLAPVASGACVVRGRRCVMLCPADPPQRQIEVLARALLDHAGDLLEARFLPPAVRTCLENARGRDGA
jgi:hypothetical protein